MKKNLFSIGEKLMKATGLRPIIKHYLIFRTITVIRTQDNFDI